MKTLTSLFCLSLLAARALAADPDFGPTVFILDPAKTADAQEKINNIFKEQERAQFGTSRYAFLFKPGRYELDFPIGFYTQVAGLGKLPGDVTIAGKGIWTDAAWMRNNATCNFWRTVENVTVEPTSGTNVWAVSQAAPMRRTHIKGNMNLSAGGWSSGGFLADCKIDGKVDAGSQQQWFSRNSTWNQWVGGNWNVVFVGCVNPMAGDWPRRPVTRIESAPILREKPYVMVEDDKWFVKVPPLKREPSTGISWEKGDAPGEAVPIEKFYIAKAGKDTAETINAALKDGKNLLITPGIYPLDGPIVVNRPNTIVLGLGLPSLTPTKGNAVFRVEAEEGVIVSGFIADAGPTESQVLVEFGIAGRKAGKAENPTVVHDLVSRVGGYGAGKAKLMVAVHNDHVIGDQFWLWRADHGAEVGWEKNTCDTGLLVEGSDVTVYGLFVEHTQKYQTMWNGERGRVYFYQSEFPYDPPTQDQWKSPTGDGYASYKVGDKVKTHEAWGLGAYHTFRRDNIAVDNGFEAPTTEDVKIRHAFTYRLSRGRPGSGARNVLNGQGGETITSTKATVD
jgi:hypothetical protein